MTPDEEQRARSTPAGREAMLEAIMPRLEVLAASYTRPGRVCEPGDLITLGWVEARRVLGRWEPRPGVPFWAYAKPFVRAVMRRAVMGAQTPSECDPEILQMEAPPSSGKRWEAKLECLSPFEKEVVEWRLLAQPRPCETEVAKKLGVTAAEVREALWVALAKLKENRH